MAISLASTAANLSVAEINNVSQNPTNTLSSSSPRYHNIKAYGPLLDHVFSLRYESYSAEDYIEKNPTKRFMDEYDSRGSLAPRDIVARAIDALMKETGAPHALLDLSPIPRERIEARFPGIMQECAARGFDIRRQPIPVVPAAHYACGGIRTDANGRTSLPGLFAAGEVACTGVHGANRLASNSLLEAVVYSHRAAQALPVSLAQAGRVAGDRGEPAVPLPEGRAPGEAWQALRASIRQSLWDDVGLVRTDARLARAARRIDTLRAGLDAGSVRDPEFLEVRNLLEVAELVVRSARLRRESRGLHHNSDYPYRDNERELRDTVLARAGA